MKEKQIIVQKLHDVLYYYLGKKLFIHYHLLTKRAIKKGKNKIYKKNRISFLMSYNLTFVCTIITGAIKLQQRAIIASQQKIFPEGGIVPGNKAKINPNGELINLPAETTIITPEIQKQLIKNNDKITIENISIQIDKDKVDDIVKNIKERTNE